MKIDIKIVIGLIFLFLIIIFGLLYTKETKTALNNDVQENTNKNIKEDLPPQINNITLSCESDEAKSIVINIFQENDTYYKYIDKNSIAALELKYPAAENYDSNIDKYECTGTIVMSANGLGFIPSEQNYDNNYYKRVHSYSEYLIGYDRYEIHVRYSVQMSEGQLLVKVSSYDLQYNGKLSCQKASCNGIINKEEYARKQQQEQRRQLKKESETMVLPE